MSYLDFVNNNLYLYLSIIITLLILDIILTIVCINQKKRRSIKKDFAEVEEANDNVDTKSLEDEVKPEVAFELEQILAKMQQDVEMQPEEVVRKFEEEQEQKAIISYQELVDSVNNNKIDVVDDEDGDMDYVAALESQLNTKSDYIETVADPTASKDLGTVDDYANKSHLDVIDQMNLDDKPKRFKNSEILSPVFGRMQPDFEYHKIDSFANTNNKVEIEQVAGDSGDSDIKNNEDFLKALIEFRNNL